MGGDHKCPVCQATFTRPQHVARHMRSHTGDRPYKCQHCGDQFARSDLLSRHINKCHANEKPPQNPGSSRRKGSASASRATTSKQACDQCVQSSLPCDGSNPCTKCTHRKARCTYVKFHRQTAPVGPGHNPRPNAPPNSNLDPPSSISSSRIPISYAQPDDFFLAPAPPSSVPTSMAETLYNAQSFAFPPLYPDSSSTAPHTDFTSKYRAQAELLRNTTALTSNGHFAPAGGTGDPVGPGFPGSANLSPPGVYSDPRSASGGSSWVSWSHDQDPSDSYDAAQQQSLHDKDMHRGHDSLSHHSHPQQQQHHQYVNHHGITHGLQQLPSGARTYPHQAQASASYLRRGSVEFGGSDGSSSAAEHSSIPSSASSSSVHLPLDNLTLQQNQGQHAHMLSFNALEDLSNHNRDYASAGSQDPAASGNNKLATDINNQSLATDGASFFPNMNMEMGGIPSLSGLPTDDPDATPMPLRESAPPVSLALPMRSASTSALNSGATPREVDSKEMRDFWKQYMRTPLSGPGPAAASESQSGANSSQQHQHQVMSPPGARRPRVASMPSSKTPTIVFSGQNGHQSQETDANREGESGVRTTLQDDLRSYEAAVMARKAPTNLSLVPKARRGTMPAVGPTAYSGPTSITQGGSPVVAGKGIGVVPSVKLDLLRQSAATDARPGSSSTTHSGSPRDSSLAGAFGVQQHLQGSPHLSSLALRRGSPGSSTGDSSSRASSVSVDQEGDTDDDAASGESGRVGRLRPAFKRLASQTLGPPNAKRAFFVPPAPMGGDVKEQQELEQHQHEAGVGVDVGRDEYGQGYAPGALGMH